MSPPVRTAIISDSLLWWGKMTVPDQQTIAQPRPRRARASRVPQAGCVPSSLDRDPLKLRYRHSIFVLRFSLFCAHDIEQ